MVQASARDGIKSPGARPAGVGPDARVLPELCFSLLILFSFILFAPIVTGDYDGAGAMSGAGDALRQVAFVLLFALTAATAVSRKGVGAVLEVPLGLVAILLWCWLSIGWAIEPAVSLRRVLFTTIVTLTVCYSVNMLDERRVVSSLAGWFTLIVVMDWLVIPLVPMAVHQPGGIEAALAGNWRGIHSHKNEAGAFCAVAALLFLDRTVRGRSFITAPVMVVLSLAFLVMTQSKTSEGFVFVGAAGGLAAVAAFHNPVLRRVLAGAALVAALAAAVFAGDRLAGLLDVFDDPGSLTGRVQIWPVLFRYASEHLVLGSGYGSFWAIGDASPVFQDGPAWLQTITHAHNGYIDLLIQTGAVGLALAIAGLVLRPLLLLATRPLASPGSRWLLGAILVFCWLHDLLETSLLDRANIVWIMMLVAYNLLERRSAAEISAAALRAEGPRARLRRNAAATPSIPPTTTASPVTRL